MTRRTFLSLSVPFVVGACGRRSAEPASAPPLASPVSPRAYAGPPRGWGDEDPHDWPGRRPYGLPVHGVDASRYDPNPDWRGAAQSGVSFAWIKATEGGDLLDPSFSGHWNAAADAGVPRGAYHVYYHCRPAEDQARWFIRNVPRQPGSLPPVLDMEWTPFSPTCTARPPAAEVRAGMAIFLRMLTAHYGTRPVIYTVPDFYDDNDLGSFAGYEYWLRSTAAHPTDRYPGGPWTFWQYSGTGTLPGFDGSTDLNAFNGSPVAFQSWLARRSVR
ncbi:glycoside hydrolase family 25 protein [Roseisalinus antarcticus]|uniref:glycoside hydrolase family 25 protein n=1 Tax=Roseisalinus antarcticus TaxID=254357 RepID=UPI000A26B38C